MGYLILLTRIMQYVIDGFHQSQLFVHLTKQQHATITGYVASAKFSLNFTAI